MLGTAIHLTSRIQVLLEVLSLAELKLMALSLNLITSSVWEVFISLFHFLVVLLLLQSFIVQFLGGIRFDKVLLHNFVDFDLLNAILSKLVLDKAGKLLLFSDLNISLEGVKRTFHLDLLHVEIEDFLVTHLVVAHKYSLTKFSHQSWGMDETEACLCSSVATCCLRTVALIPHTRELLFTGLRIGVGYVYVAVGLIMQAFCHHRSSQGGCSY